QQSRIRHQGADQKDRRDQAPRPEHRVYRVGNGDGRRRRQVDGNRGEGLMRVHGKKYRAASEKRNPETRYQPRQAIDIVKSSSFAKFDETVEIAVRLGVDPKHADQAVRGTVVLPAGTGKSVRVLVIASGDKTREAEASGAYYGGTESVQKVEECLK